MVQAKKSQTTGEFRCVFLCHCFSWNGRVRPKPGWSLEFLSRSVSNPACRHAIDGMGGLTEMSLLSCKLHESAAMRDMVSGVTDRECRFGGSECWTSLPTLTRWRILRADIEH